MCSRRLRGWSVSVVALLAAAACDKAPRPDAYGNVEAVEVVVSAETSGRLVALTVDEGQMVDAGVAVGSIDPALLDLERDRATADRGAMASRVTEVGRRVAVLDAQRAAAQAQQESAEAQAAALRTERAIAKRAFERTDRLFAAQAATAQQRDQAEREYRVLDDRIVAQERLAAAQGQQVVAARAQMAATDVERQGAEQQVAAADAQVAHVGERIRRSQITNPTAGTVLVTYARPGEFVQAGQPLYKIANLRTVDVRAWVAEPQLSALRIGQQVAITTDAPGGQHPVLPGTVSWISAEAEFTPTPIQTRDERASLVYAIKIRVANPDGQLKIGMPVDVRLGTGGGS